MATNGPSVVNTDEFTVTRTVQVNAAPEKVWAAITAPEHIVGWFGQGAVLDRVAVGGHGSFTFEGYGEFPVQIEQLDPMRSITFRWGNENAHAIPIDPDRSTTFTFTLEPVDGGTQLTVVEAGFDKLTDPAASMESNRGGWNSELDELVAYLESDS